MHQEGVDPSSAHDQCYEAAGLGFFGKLAMGLEVCGTCPTCAETTGAKILAQCCRGAQDPPACFVSGTPVLTPSGRRQIEEIAVGDTVLTMDLHTSQRVQRNVLHTVTGRATKLIRLTTTLGDLRCTERHRFCVAPCEWVRSSEVKVGDFLISAGGTPVRVDRVTVELLKHPVRVFNLAVNEHHYYFVGEAAVLVHNDKP